MPDVNRPTQGYLPTLDGWRTISILSVILSHDRIHHFGPLSTKWFYLHGHIGVDIFFAISGLLICSRLMVEEESSGCISMRNFYVRRAFRILPAASFYLVTLLLLKLFAGLAVGVPEVLASFFFLRNYTFIFSHFQTIYPGYTGHFWSLAIEEHFYLILPALLVLAPKRWRIPLLAMMALAVAWHRTAAYSWMSQHTDMRIDALIVPALFAILLRRSIMRAWFARWSRLWPLLVLAVLIPISYDFAPRTRSWITVWIFPMMILGTMLHPENWFSRILELPVMRYVGRLSYSIYLWQQLFFVSHYGEVSTRIRLLQSWPWCLVMTAATAAFSYYFVERPCIKLGHRLAPNAAANRIERSEVQLSSG